ncbi:MAG: glycosyltransferase, partial [Pseudomonadota bacterium]|nr:glycosyltransferase [Pseudomonadota bacterium]
LKGMFRSCRLSDFEGVLKRRDLQFYSLQVDITEQERDVLQSYGGIDLSSQINDFADSAALTKHMDLILSVDTAQAHLAGGLGIPVWMLLARGADWRWFRYAENSPWYPSMRIFRQTERGNWRIPIGNIENMLDTFFSAGR